MSELWKGGEPMIYITYEVAVMLRYAVEQAKGKEVGGLAKTHIFGNSRGVLLKDILIPPQMVTGSNTDIGPDALMGIVELLAKRREVCLDWRCWWHVHPFAQGKPVPSNTDHDTLDSLAQELGWAIGLIIGKNGDYHAWLSILEPLVMEIDVEVRVLEQEFPNLEKKVAEMMKLVEVSYPKPFTWVGSALRPHIVGDISPHHGGLPLHEQEEPDFVGFPFHAAGWPV
jgi:hypothetical protein